MYLASPVALANGTGQLAHLFGQPSHGCGQSTTFIALSVRIRHKRLKGCQVHTQILNEGAATTQASEYAGTLRGTAQATVGSLIPLRR